MAHTIHRSAGAAAFVTLAAFGAACGEKSPALPRPASPASTNVGASPAAASTATPSSRATQSPAPAHPPYPASDALTTQYAALGVRLPPLRTLARRSGTDFPGFNVASDDAIPTWKKLRALTDKTGWYPLVVRDTFSMLGNLDNLAPASPQEIRRAADDVDIDAWRESRRRQVDEDWADQGHQLRSPGDTSLPNESFCVPFEVNTGEPVDDVYIVLLPTTSGADVPALLGCGAWSEYLDSEVHVALLRKWHRDFGSDPVTFRGDTIEFLVSRRPATLDEAITLATEQFFYCEDIVTQGCESIDALADYLMKSDIWYFWWD